LSILVDGSTRVVVQGLGRDGSFHASQMKQYGTRVVGGVHPGRGGELCDGIPVFNTVIDAVAETAADCCVTFVPAPHAADAILESASAGVRLVVAITEGIPVRDMTRVVSELGDRGTLLVGPNCPGLISPGRAKVGIMPGRIFRQGPVGIVSRSGTLTYEVVNRLSEAGFGQSTAVGMGGDPVVGMSFVDYLEMFQEDPETEAVVLVGEIGGTDEQDAASFFRRHMSKPVIAYIVGRSAPSGKRMGHAGAIISGAGSTVEDKITMLRDNGIPVAGVIEEIVDLVRGKLGGGS